MAKKRVHEIAKERGITSKEALEILQTAGLGVTAAASSVEEADAAKAFGKGGTATKAPAKATKAAAKGDGAKAKGGAKAKAKADDGAAASAAEAKADEGAVAAEGEADGGAAAPAAESTGGAKPKSGGAAKKAQAARPAITRPPSPEGEVKRAGPEGRGPRILQEAPPPEPPKPQGAQRGGPRQSDGPSAPSGGGGRGPGGPGGPGGGPRGGSAGGGGSRPTRGGRGGEGDGGGGGGQGGRRRRVVIDSQAARRDRTPPPPQQPARRGRGRRRRPQWVEPDLEAQAAAAAAAALEEDPPVAVRSGSTVTAVAESLKLPAPEVIEVLAEGFDKKVTFHSASEDVEEEPVYEDSDEELIERPPVITIMGHVDHGKTSLLDAIRETEVASGEAGGITQHIGAYQVHHGDHTITFLDTPGHEAFTAMRARGAKVTDIAVIVVAADDGVMPQTVEAIDHAKAAEVPVMVAVNKIDKEGSDPNRVRGELAQQGLTPADWGGDTEFVDVSAKTKQNLDDLLETLVTLAEIQELRANPEADASGFVIESRLDPGRGPVVTLLIHRGRLEVGDSLTAGEAWGRVRAMHDYRGQALKEATPGMPVEVLGFDGVPDAGETFRVVQNDREAKRVANERSIRVKQEALARQGGRRVSLEDVLARAERGEKELNLVLKADVAGSLEALADEIVRLPQEQVQVNIIREGVGGIAESDVMLAAASDAVIIGFNVRPVGNAAQVADREGVEIRTYSVIYNIIEDLRAAMEGLLDAKEVEEAVGTAEVRATFKASRVGTIAGSYVTDGVMRRGVQCRLVRDGTVVYDGRIGSLRRFKDDVREVTAGMECGIVLENYPDPKEGDVIEAHEIKQVEQTLS